MKGVCFAIALAIFAACAAFFPKHVPVIVNWIQTLGMIAPVLFLLLYCFATLCFLPTMVLTLAGGILFGPVFGTLFNLLGATLGATLAFLISRYKFSAWFANQKNAGIHKLISGVEKRGWQFVALIRLIPIIPFNLVNYGLGLTKIRFSHYLITTFVFLIPTEVISTYCGYAGMDYFIRSNIIYREVLMAIVMISIFTLITVKIIKHRQLHRPK